LGQNAERLRTGLTLSFSSACCRLPIPAPQLPVSQTLQGVRRWTPAPTRDETRRRDGMRYLPPCSAFCACAHGQLWRLSAPHHACGRISALAAASTLYLRAFIRGGAWRRFYLPYAALFVRCCNGCVSLWFSKTWLPPSLPTVTHCGPCAQHCDLLF